MSMEDFPLPYRYMILYTMFDYQRICIIYIYIFIISYNIYICIYLIYPHHISH